MQPRVEKIHKCRNRRRERGGGERGGGGGGGGGGVGGGGGGHVGAAHGFCHFRYSTHAPLPTELRGVTIVCALKIVELTTITLQHCLGVGFLYFGLNAVIT